MKKLILLFLAAHLFLYSHAQEELPAVDKSPLDVCYYPDNYPQLKAQGKPTAAPAARVIYSRPQKGNRTIFGALIEYGKLWRMGANEATEIEFYQPVTIGGNKIPKGRYTVYAIPESAYWTIIINKETDVWGSFIYKESKDIARIKVPVEMVNESLETLAMKFEKETDKQIKLIIAWDMVKVTLPVSI